MLDIDDIDTKQSAISGTSVLQEWFSFSQTAEDNLCYACRDIAKSLRYINFTTNIFPVMLTPGASFFSKL